MSEIMHQRRRLLLSTAAWVGGLATVNASWPIRAFQVEDLSRGVPSAAPMPSVAAAPRSTRL